MHGGGAGGTLGPLVVEETSVEWQSNSGGNGTVDAAVYGYKGIVVLCRTDSAPKPEARLCSLGCKYCHLPWDLPKYSDM